MSRGSNFLETDSKNTKEKNLNRSSRGVPEGTTDSVVPSDVGTLEEGGRPCPLRDDDGGGETGFDGAASGAVELEEGRRRC